MKELASDLFYVGVNDRHRRNFEGLWPVPSGVSYNSYLIIGEKIALIDTVGVAFFPQFIQKIQEVVGNRSIDYLVINHMEPDHSGSISLVRQYFPEVTLVGNKKTLEMVSGFYGEQGNVLTVGDGDVLELGGGHSLRFFLTPMVHWPETMMSYDRPAQALFSGDAFGCFGALNGGVLDNDLDLEIYWDEMYRYYSNIVGKYGTFVQKALAKLADVPLRMICSTHGPVWTAEIDRVVGIYDRLSRYEAEQGLVIAYGSMYGNTEQMAEAVAEGAITAGLKKVVVRNVSDDHHSYILSDIFRYRGLVVGCPTYNSTLYPPMEALLGAISSRGVSGRLFGVFSSFTWGNILGKQLAAWCDNQKFDLIGDMVENKQGCDATTLEKCRHLGRVMAEKILSDGIA